MAQTAASERGAYVMIAVVLLCAMTVVNYIPWRAIDKYHNYLGLRPDIRYLAKQYNFGKSLVLIQSAEEDEYASAAIYNPIDLRAEAPIYAWDASPEVRSRLLQAYPDRPVWVVTIAAANRDRYKVVAGPLSSQELMTKGN